MNLKESKIIYFAQYAAPYPGNFIRSLISLADTLKQNYNSDIFFVFPESAKKTAWIESFSTNYTTFYTSDDVENSSDMICQIIKKIIPNIVHTHFDGYDIPVTKVVREICIEKMINISIVWHLHDHFSFQKNILKKFYQYYCFYRHYTHFGKYASVVSVSSESLRFLRQFSINKQFIKSIIIPNGVDLERLKPYKDYSSSLDSNSFTFLAFGGRNDSKRIDLLIKAGFILQEYKYDNFKIIITKGTDTIKIVNDIVGNNYPSWLKILPQSDIIVDLFAKADCFVSTSVAETFSYAIAEASIYGLPVIQSDIEGTLWNASNPSTFLFKNLNVFDLVDKMKDVMSLSIDKIKEYCLITRKNNIEKYTIEAWTKKIIKFYEEL